MENQEISTVNDHLNEANYQYESGGILVYDYEAAMYKAVEPRIEPREKPSSGELPASIKVELHNALPSDVKSYISLGSASKAPDFAPKYPLRVPEESLIFDSKFESGNLRRAIMLTPHEYILLLSNDTSTSGNTHWFYFSVSNSKKSTVTFRITNMHKPDLLYSQGMQPAVFSSHSPQLGWHRSTYGVTYTSNSQQGSSNTLTFTYDFRTENDTVFFAYTVPYTYQDLVKYTTDISNSHSRIAKVETLCESLGGNACPLITITEEVQSLSTFENATSAFSQQLAKRGIVVTGRVHSGETVSSHVMKGMLDYLLSDSAHMLRKTFVFKIVPMLNPDGVRYGNYRGNLIGVDLNRRWLNPNKVLHPTIYYTKQMIENFDQNHEIVCYIDLHGHSKKRGAFMYGCSQRSNNDVVKKRKELMVKMLPYLMSHVNPFFSLQDSHYRIEKGREGTARVVMYSQYNITHSYTLEATSYGSPYQETHMVEKDFESVGRDLCKLFLALNGPRTYIKQLRSSVKQLPFAQPFLEDFKPFSIKEILICEQFWKDMEAGIVRKHYTTKKPHKISLSADIERNTSMTMLPPERPLKQITPSKEDSRWKRYSLKPISKSFKPPMNAIKLKQAHIEPNISPRQEFTPNLNEPLRKDYLEIVSTIYKNKTQSHQISDRKIPKVPIKTIGSLQGNNREYSRVMYMPRFNDFNMTDLYSRINASKALQMDSTRNRSPRSILEPIKR